MDKTRVKALQSVLKSQHREVGELVLKLLDRDGLLRGRNWLPSDADSTADWLPAAVRASGYWVVLTEAEETVRTVDVTTDTFLQLCEKAPDAEPPMDMELQSRPGLEEAKVKNIIAPEQPLSEVKLEQAIEAMCNTATELADDFRKCFQHIIDKPTGSILSAEVLPIFKDFHEQVTATTAAMLRCRLPAPDSYFKAAANDLLEVLEKFSPVLNALAEKAQAKA